MNKSTRILAFERPDLLEEWDFEKNSLICAPDDVSIWSKTKVWWICKTCGHNWKAAISNRVNNSGCPNCAGRVIKKGVNDLLSNYPLLCKEWDYQKNTIKPDEVTCGSNRKVWWKCQKCEYEWQASIDHRVNGRGCPYCAGKALWRGHNDLETLSPQIASEWNCEKNSRKPSDYQNGSSKSVWWKCSNCGYEWEMQISSRTYGGQGCPYCGHNAVWQGHNDLKTTHTKLCEEWDYEKNEGISPEHFSAGSHKKVWWRCRTCNYSWKATIKDRLTRGCPHCAGKVVWEGHNDISTTDPELLEEWDFQKNRVAPTEVSRGSGKRVWWICKKCKGSWQETVDRRAVGGYGCPYCSGKRVLKGYNDLATKHPYLLKEWDYSKNKSLTPYTVTSKSSRKVWWKCQICGTSYYKLISDRTSGVGCPRCSKSQRTSLPEQIIYFYIHAAYPKAKNEYKPKWLHGKEIDIFIPELHIGIEYDGRYWHNDAEKDLSKNKILKERGISLYRIREPDAPKIEDGTTIFITDNYKSDGSHVLKVLHNLFDNLQQYDKKISIPNIDIDRDRNTIISQYVVNKKAKSLEARYPLLIEEWDVVKNGDLHPNQIAAGSGNRVWWKCAKCGQSWEASPKDRTNGHGCPYCAGVKIASGVNDLATLKPEIAKEWCYEKNGDITPSMISISEKRQYWWKCSRCGKIWKTSPAAHKKPGCPNCNHHSAAKQRHLIVGKTDLATLHPELLEEWMYDRNDWTDPTNETAQSHEKVWWKCKVCGHEWEAAIGDRSSGHGCPKCAKQKRVAGRKIPLKGQSFGELYPDLLNEWDYEKNKNITPYDFKPFSSVRVWWKCSKCGREWQTSISNRAAGSGCRSCVHSKKKSI